MEHLKAPLIPFKDQEIGLGDPVIDVEALLKDLIARFNKKVTEDEKLRNELRNMTRKIEVKMRDGESYNFLLEDLQLKNFSKGEVSEPDISIISDTKSFEALVKREIGPMRALATGKVKIKAPLEDMLRLRKLF